MTKSNEQSSHLCSRRSKGVLANFLALLAMFFSADALAVTNHETMTSQGASASECAASIAYELQQFRQYIGKPEVIYGCTYADNGAVIAGDTDGQPGYFYHIQALSGMGYLHSATGGFHWPGVVCYPPKIPQSDGSCKNPPTPPPTDQQIGCYKHNPNGPNVCQGDPIDSGTGNESLEQTDLVISGLLRFDRYYNSDPVAPSHLLGPHWTNVYSRRVTQVDSTHATVLRPDGHDANFVYAAGVWTASGEDQFAHLDRLTDGSGNLTGWRYRQVDDREIEDFDRLGRLMAITDGDGNQVVLIYNNGVISNGPNDYLLTSVTAQDGRKLTLSYDTNRRLTHVIDPSGADYAYAYDGTGHLQSVTFPGGTTNKTYEYNNSDYTAGANLPDALTGIFDEKGQRYATYNYLADGRAWASEHNSGTDHYEIYYFGTGFSSIASPLGAVEMRMLTAPAGAYRVSSTSTVVNGITSNRSYTYDAYGRLDLTTDALGTITDTDYNSRGLLTQVIENTANTGSTRRTTQTDWHATYSLPIERRIYDSSTGLPGTLKLRDQWTYNSRGQVLSHVRVGANNSSITRTTTYTYCDSIGTGCPLVGLLTKIDGERTGANDFTTFSYYTSSDACVPTSCRIGDLKSVKNAKNQVTTYLSYDGDGRPLQVSDANGVITDLVYSPRGWLTAIKRRGTDNSMEADDSIVTLAYDATGKVTRVTQPDGSYLDYIRDTAQRVSNIRDYIGNSKDFTRDLIGDITHENDYLFGVGTVHSSDQVFDALGRLQQAKNAAGYATTLTYDAEGNPDQATDPNNHVTDQNVDALGRVTQTTQDAGTGGLAVPTQLQYNSLDQVTQVTDPKGLNTVYTYNGFGDLITLASPDTGTTSSTLQDAGLLATATDARGVQLTYGYDALNRVTSVTGPTTAQNFTYAYDSLPADCDSSATSIEKFSVGHLSQITDESGSTRFCYDRFGRVVRKVQSVTGGSTLPTVSVYDHAGHVVSMTYPSGAIVSYLRNANGQITRIDAKPTATAAQVTLVSDAQYLPFGPRGNLTFGNGRVFYTSYDLNYGIDKVNDNASSNPISEDYTLDPVGNVTGLSEKTSATTSVDRTYTYDGLDRLTAEKNGTSTVEGFAYNGTGDRTSKTVASTSNYSYGSTSHWLTNIAGVGTRTYDNAGDTLTLGTNWVNTFDDHRRLRTITLGGTLQRTYYYNALGQRVYRVANAAPASTLQFVYDQAGHLLGEYNSAGTRIAEYVWLDNTLVGVLKTAEGSTYQYVETDALGTPRAVINPVNNTIIWRWDLNPTTFGDHLINNDPDGNGTAYGFNLRYAGQYWEGLGYVYYNGFRDYDASTGRYLESDPIGLNGGNSTYGYVSGNPLNRYDPYGLLGAGVFGGGSAEAGLFYKGAAAQASSGIIHFARLCDSGRSADSVGVYSSTGGFHGGNSEFNWPGEHDPSNSNQGGWTSFVAGIGAGLGVGAIITNADTVDQLKGPFDTWNFSAGIWTVQYAQDDNSGIFTVSIGVAKSNGLSLSRYRVDTDATQTIQGDSSECGCNR